MKNIVVFGAGMSSSVLIDYLADIAPKNDWIVSVGDRDLELAKRKTKERQNTHAFKFDVTDENAAIERNFQRPIWSFLCLPAHMHVEVARQCIALKKAYGYGKLRFKGNGRVA